MIDGADEIVVMTSDLDQALSLYRGHLGFEVIRQANVNASAFGPLWGLELSGEVPAALLGKPGSAGGWLRLVGLRETPTAGTRSMADAGPFAVDFYVRGLRNLYEELLAAGWTFRSEPQTYELFGAGFTVEEVLLEGPEGLLHALVEYIPDRHRCSLSDHADRRVSEVVAAVTVTRDVDAGVDLLSGALGAEVYFDQVFEGEAVEALLDLPSGTSFRTVLVRGVGRRNARIELMAAVDDHIARNVAGGERGVPRVVLACAVDNLDRALGRASEAGATVVGPIEVDDEVHGRTRLAGVHTAWGGKLELREGRAAREPKPN